MISSISVFSFLVLAYKVTISSILVFSFRVLPYKVTISSIPVFSFHVCFLDLSCKVGQEPSPHHYVYWASGASNHISMDQSALGLMSVSYQRPSLSPDIVSWYPF